MILPGFYPSVSQLAKLRFSLGPDRRTRWRSRGTLENYERIQLTANELFSDTIRLNTGRPGAVSFGSTLK